MSILEDATGVLARAVQYAGISGGPGYDVRRAGLFADPVPVPPPPPAGRRTPVETRTIHDVKHPWVEIEWPVDVPIPPGWMSDAQRVAIEKWLALMREQASHTPGYVPRPPVTRFQGDPSALHYDPVIDESSPAFGLVRQVAEAAADAAAGRGLRETLAELRGVQVRTRLAARVTPGAPSGRTPRPPRAPRRPRPPRAPRTPRRPRPPRVNGTKGTLPRKPCTVHGVGGGCDGGTGCNVPAELRGPNVGHSTCNWGPMDDACNCVNMGCDGVAAKLLKPFLELLPKYWSEQAVALAKEARQGPNKAAAAARRFSGLPPISPGAAQVPPTGYPRDPNASGGGCACQSWPGWIICPNCSGGRGCTCQGRCIALPANSGNC